MNPSRNRQRGKETERAVAKKLGGKRIGILGSEDVQHNLYSIEVKSRKSFVADNWMNQCKKNNKENKIPLVVVHKTGRDHENDLVIISLKDFMNLNTTLQLSNSVS